MAGQNSQKQINFSLIHHFNRRRDQQYGKYLPLHIKLSLITVVYLPKTISSSMRDLKSVLRRSATLDGGDWVCGYPVG